MNAKLHRGFENIIGENLPKFEKFWVQLTTFLQQETENRAVLTKNTAFTYWLVTSHKVIIVLWSTPHLIMHNNLKRLMYR